MRSPEEEALRRGAAFVGAVFGTQDMEAVVQAVKDTEGKMVAIDIKLRDPGPEERPEFHIRDRNAQAMIKRRMSPMEMTRAMVGGVAKHELPPPVTPGAGGWREQPTKTRSKAEREKRRKAKAARRKNR